MGFDKHEKDLLQPLQRKLCRAERSCIRYQLKFPLFIHHLELEISNTVECRVDVKQDKRFELFRSYCDKITSNAADRAWFMKHCLDADDKFAKKWTGVVWEKQSLQILTKNDDQAYFYRIGVQLGDDCLVLHLGKRFSTVSTLHYEYFTPIGENFPCLSHAQVSHEQVISTLKNLVEKILNN